MHPEGEVGGVCTEPTQPWCTTEEQLALTKLSPGEESALKAEGYTLTGFNQYVSDRTSLKRHIPDNFISNQCKAELKAIDTSRLHAFLAPFTV